MKDFFYNFFLNKKLNKHTKNATYFRYNKVKKIGILFNLCTHNLDQIKQFSKKLNLKKIEFTYICFTQKTPKQENTKNVFYFNKKSFNWRSKPKDKNFKAIIDTSFDILIDFSKKDNKYCKNIVISSISKFKIGFYEDKLYDFMSNHKDLYDIAENLNNYLKYIN